MFFYEIHEGDEEIGTAVLLGHEQRIEPTEFFELVKRARALVEPMNAAIVHRGPDEGSVDSFGRCVLGHQRLRVLDPAQGYQPVASESGDVVAVFNGELYNFRELRAELDGHELRGTGDTPVLPHLYEEDGPAFVRRLSGMFALALWDARRERLVLARDRVGKKPLLWTRLDDGTLAFASELKALLRLPEVPREVDREVFYRVRESGGTKISSAYEAVKKIIQDQYPPDEWNIYCFQFSDGDNWGEDNRQALAMLREEIMPKCNLFCYGQVESPYGSGEFYRVLEEAFGTEHETLVLSEIENREAIYDSIKTFLGKGK